jgi:cytochrome d ubiquinol oxidase subunit I
VIIVVHSPRAARFGSQAGAALIMSLLDLSRWQFAFTVMFHMTFPAVTVGLAVFLTVVFGVYWRTGNTVFLQLFRFWKRIFAVAFALGVVSGTVITFEFGLNWGGYAAKAGPVVAPIIGMEVVTAFFVEAGFIGVMLYGDGRVKKGMMFAACGIVALGTILSTTWIMAANSWMQVPRGFTIENGQFVPTDWLEVIFTPAFAWRFPHMLVAVLISAALFIAGISAYYLLKHRAKRFSRRSFSIALGMLAMLIPLQLSLGDHVAGEVLVPYQLPKLEAMEGNWDSTNTGYNVFVIPDMESASNTLMITVPWLGSAIAKDLSGQTPTPGLLKTAPEDRPNIWTVFYGFRAMFYGSMLIFATAMIGVVLRVRRRLWDSPWFHRFVLWMTPLGVIAILGGWVTAETGRQPFVVYGHLRTSDAVSNLAPQEVVLSVAGFMTLYLALLVAFIVYVARAVKRGPEADDPALDDADIDSDADADADAYQGTR